MLRKKKANYWSEHPYNLKVHHNSIYYRNLLGTLYLNSLKSIQNKFSNFKILPSFLLSFLLCKIGTSSLKPLAYLDCRLKVSDAKSPFPFRHLHVGSVLSFYNNASSSSTKFSYYGLLEIVLRQLSSTSKNIPMKERRMKKTFKPLLNFRHLLQ